MIEGRRPGGLTALAVLNFVFGGLNVFSVLFLITLLAVADKTAGDAFTDAMREQKIEPTFLYVQIGLGLVVSALMIVSGVGYLGLKRVLGRTMGNTFSIISIGSSVVGVLTQGLNVWVLIGLVYPVLTLVLLNTTFKDDLVN